MQGCLIRDTNEKIQPSRVSLIEENERGFGGPHNYDRERQKERKPRKHEAIIASELHNLFWLHLGWPWQSCYWASKSFEEWGPSP